MRKLVGAGAALVVAACGRADQRAAAPPPNRHASVPFAPPRDTVTLTGVYQRDRDESRFQICGLTRIFRVSARDSVMKLLDANVDWLAPRPTTTMYASVGGDTIAEGHDSANAGVLTIVTVDEMRGLNGAECDPKARPRPPRPPSPHAPAPAAVRAALRAALGADSGLALPANYRSAPVWLDNDTLADLLVLLRAPTMCAVPGCTLFVFAGTADGYKLIGRTTSVVAPVQVRRWPNPYRDGGFDQEATEGKLDIQVKVNGGAFGLRDAILRYRDGHYPRDAGVEPPPGGRRGGVAASGTTVLP